MTYAAFKNWCKSVCAKAAANCVLKFRNEDGKFVADYGDVRMTANRLSESITVLTGSNYCHQFMVRVGSGFGGGSSG